MLKLRFQPSSAGYAFKPGDPNVSTELDGGVSATRTDILNPSDMVQCSWYLENDIEYEEFIIFFKGPAKEGAAWFLMDLVLDEAQPVERTCKFMTGTFQLVEVDGPRTMVSAQLEVEPIYYDPAYFDTLQMLITEYGSLANAQPVLNQFDQLINVDFPESLDLE